MFSIDYFIKKFEAIPAKLWCQGTIKGLYISEYKQHQHCVLGHCGVKDMLSVPDCLTPEAEALFDIFGAEKNLAFKGKGMGPDWEAIYNINDDKIGGGWRAKSNILKHLNKLKQLEDETNNIISDAVNAQ
jgi:hypothetical protein